MPHAEILKSHLETALKLPADAVDWLMGLWRVTQVFDDVADGDPVERPDLDAAIWDALAGMPANPFFQRHQAWLIPATSQMVLKWQVSDRVEREGKASERSFIWRAGFYDVVLMVAAIVHGPNLDVAATALGLYGEEFQEYMEEMKVTYA